MDDDKRLFAPAAARNREAIAAALRAVLPERGLLLEVASGSGEHVAHLAPLWPGLAFQPTDAEPAARDSIDAWCAGLPNVRPALALDAASAAWPVARADVVMCINMIHIAPWAATVGLVRGAAGVLSPGGVLVLYGPFREGGAHTGEGNAAFDADLRARDPAWGIRDVEAVAAEAAEAFDAPAIGVMPANNRLVVLRRR